MHHKAMENVWALAFFLQHQFVSSAAAFALSAYERKPQQAQAWCVLLGRVKRSDLELSFLISSVI
jgi:hypothetical protein